MERRSKSFTSAARSEDGDPRRFFRATCISSIMHSCDVIDYHPCLKQQPIGREDHGSEKAEIFLTSLCLQSTHRLRSANAKQQKISASQYSQGHGMTC
ncbi:hypothetical protein Ancab_013426 [Ancistrocladus abbreviatus]